MKNALRALALGCATAAIGLGTNVLAADADHDDAANRTAIIVNGILPSAGQTATKTDVPIFDTPISVQSVTAATLQDQAVVSLDQALGNVSGVTVGAGGGADNGQPFSTITIRGFGSDSHFRNGVRLDSFGSDSGTQATQIANVDSVDVLKGPAAILYGQVEPGGIVNIVTKQPLARPAYAAEAQVGSYAFYRGVADATGPLTGDGKLLYRLIGSVQHAGSPVDLVYNHTQFLAPSLAWIAGANDKVTVEAEYRFLDEGQNYGYQLGYGAVPTPQLGDIHTNYGETSPLKEVNWLGTLRWNHTFSKAWSLTVQELYNTIHVNGAGIFPFYLQADSTVPSGYSVGRFVNNVFDHDYTISSNVDLVGHFTTGALAHTLLIGGDFVHFLYDGGINQIAEFDPTAASSIDAFNPVHPGTAFGSPASLLFNGLQNENTGGAYVQDQVTLPHGLYLLAGARFQYVHEAQSFSGQPQPSLTGTKVTPRVGVLWEAAPWLSLYANYAENFGASNGYGVQPNGQVVPPTTGRQWETGAKFQSASKRLSATVAWYHLVKTNVPYPDPANPNFSLVAGEERSQGLEVDVQGEITPGWQVIANYAYTDAVVLKNAPAYALDANGNPDPTNPIVTLLGPPGTPLGEVPRHLAHLWTTYAWRAGALNGLKLGGGATFHGAAVDLYPGYVLAASSGATLPVMPGWQTFDVTASYAWHVGGKKLTFQINASNITDRRYFQDIQQPGFPGVTLANGTSVTGLTALYGAPRTVTGSIRVEF